MQRTVNQKAKEKKKSHKRNRKKNNMESDSSDCDIDVDVKSDNVTDCKEEKMNLVLVDNDESLKPNVCQTCGLRFRSKRALDKHSTEHNDKGRYVCHECQECFEDLRALKEHRWTHGEGMAKRIKCEFCHQRFTSKRGLDKHVKEKHSADNHIDFCADTFSEMKDIPLVLNDLKKIEGCQVFDSAVHDKMCLCGQWKTENEKDVHISGTHTFGEVGDIPNVLDHIKKEENCIEHDSIVHDHKCLCA